MSLNHYNLYLEQVFQLAETIVIKSEGSAQSINDRLKYLYGDSIVDPTDKTTWKYYLNLAGKYHPTDKKIIITSLDTLQPIEFNADNLRIHTATAQAYEYGSRYYRELVSQYSTDYEQIILGALYPVDIQKAIDAPDFSVIGYPSKYIESNEESLVYNINKWLKNFETRWFNIQYTMSDNLYLTTTLMVMYQMLVPLIITLRLRACKTREAHSYHVREYLASHGMLDEYLDYMTKKQALFFYRNINYIERNAGKNETFDWLLERVLTERNIPVSEINLSQDDSELLTSYRPVSRFARVPINDSTAAATSITAFYTLSELLNKEMSQAPGNADFVSANYSKIDDTITRSKTNFLKTKVLESNMVDYTDAGLYSIQDIAIDLWCYMSVSGQYSAVINFTETTSGQNVSIPNHEAFLYFLYAYAQVYEIPIDKIPEFYATRVAIDPIPSLEDLEKVVDKKYVSRDDLVYLLSLHTPLETAISATAFHDFIKRTHVSYKAENMFSVIQNGLNKKAMLKNASLRLYKAQRVVSPHMGKSFEEVFKGLGLTYSGLSKDEWASVYKEIYFQATGIDANLTDSAAAMQQAMISLFLKLSSYSIQFISDINRTTIRSINWSGMRMGDISRYGRDSHNVKLAVFQLFSKLSTSKDYRFIELKNLLQKFYVWARTGIGFVDVTLKAWQVPAVVNKIININKLRYDIDKFETCQLALPEGLPEFSPYFDLPLEDKHKVRDVYQDRVSDDDYIPQIDIDTIEHIPKNIRTNYFYRPSDHVEGFEYKYVVKSFDFRVDRDFTELDAFDSNFGELDAPSFVPFVGFKKNDLGFKLTPGPAEVIVDSFKYTGGIRYNPGFGYSRHPDLDVDLGSFHLVFDPPDQLGSIRADYDTRILHFFYNTFYSGINLGNYQMKREQGEVGPMQIIIDKQTIDMGTLAAGSLTINFKFNANPATRMHLFFKPNFQFFDIGGFKMEVGNYQLGSFSFLTDKRTLRFILNYGAQNLGTMQFISADQVIHFNEPLMDTQTLNNINFAAGSMNLGVYKFDNLGSDLGDTHYISTDVNISQFKWSAHDIDALLVVWEDLTTDEGNFVMDTGFEDIEDTTLELVTQELGEVTYDPVLKETGFID